MAKMKADSSSILLSLMLAVLPRLPFGESVAATTSDVDGLLTTFSKADATRFGERPSDTLRRAGHSVSA